MSGTVVVPWLGVVPVLDDDTEDTLHERIKQVERRLYPDVIERLVADESVADESVADESGARS